MALEDNRSKSGSNGAEDTSVSPNSGQKSKPKQNTNSRPRRRNLRCDYHAGIEGGLIPKICESDGIKKLYKNLINRFDSSDVVQVLLVEMTVADYWRASKAIEYEYYYSGGKPGNWYLANPDMMRYNSANRRNLHKSIEMLLQLDKEADQASAFAQAEEDPSGTFNVDSSLPDAPISNSQSYADPPESVPSTVDYDEDMPDLYVPRTDICRLDECNDYDLIPEEPLPSTTPMSLADETAGQPNAAELNTPGGNIENDDDQPDADLPKAA